MTPTSWLELLTVIIFVKITDSGNVLETCCCRPESNPASCQKVSPFCTGRPIFTLAEPSDLVISCGDFNSGVEILNLSREPEQIFTVTKIVNHPHYQPNRVRKFAM